MTQACTLTMREFWGLLQKGLDRISGARTRCGCRVMLVDV